MKGILVKYSGDSVPLSFQYKSHENLSIDTVASTSEPLTVKEVLLSLVVAAHVKIGEGDATVADFVMPSGIWPLLIEEGQTISVLKLTGAESGQASIITTEN